MYHCHTRFCLVGEQEHIFDIIKETPPIDFHFTHEFLDGGTPDELAAKADIIFAELHDKESEDILRRLVDCMKEGGQLIVLADKSVVEALSAFPDVISDIWTLPMSDAEVKFRLLKLLRAWKDSKDAWEMNQFFDAAMSSVPNLVWYKDKEGIHVRVNGSFCEACGKTEEQIKGRDHFYIWDVDPDDPEVDGNACMESELMVMASGETCVSEESVKTGAGMRLFTTYKSPLYDIDGTVMGTVGIGIDITQERAYEQELTKQNHTLETIFTSLDCGAVCYRLSDRLVTDVNDVALGLLNHLSEDLVGPNVLAELFVHVAEGEKAALFEFFDQIEVEGSGSIGCHVQRGDDEVNTIMIDAEVSEEDDELFCQLILLDCS